MPVSRNDYNFAVNLMQFLVVPTFVLDKHGRVLIWNKACERLTGLSGAEMIGTKYHWRAFYEVPRPCLADLILEKRMSEINALYVSHDEDTGRSFGVHAENWCVMPKLQTQLFLAIDAGAIYDENGDLLAVVETLRDMTIQKMAQIELEKLVTHDGLTGIVNRRGFDEELEKEWRKAARDQTCISLIMMDVDQFKEFNDTYGHQAGDECLKKIAKVISKSVFRPMDLAARYGGEEFSAVLPECECSGAIPVAQRIQEDIAALRIPHSRNPNGLVTISLGIACICPKKGQMKEELIAYADKALYRAKALGRDRIAVAESMDILGGDIYIVD